LEQAGQIYRDDAVVNDFGLANLWFDDTAGQFVWLDTLAAFKHKKIFGFLRYEFHEALRKHFYPDTPDRVTYNRIHTDLFRSSIAPLEHIFDPEVYKRVMENLDLYEDIVAAKDPEECTKRAIKPAVINTKDVVKEVPGKLYKKAIGAFELGAAIFSSKIRRKLVFEGIEEARATGLVTQKEFQEAEELFNLNEQLKKGTFRFKLAELAMLGYFIGNSLGTKAIEGAAHTFNLLSDNEALSKTLISLGIYLGGYALSSSSRFIGTNLIGGLTQVDLRAAARVSALPLFGNVLPFPVQTLVNTGSDSSLLLHYAVRKVLGDLSGLHPAGGLGTEYEARLYQWLGPKIEALAVEKKN
jgi:hypothetical protein